MESAIKQKPRRRTQERTGITRAKLLEAAASLFIEHGYEGVGIKDIKTTAGVQRGLLCYHFQDKETLWKAMASRTFKLMEAELEPRMEIIRELDNRERIAFIIRFYVRFSARNPELPRLLSQEARHKSWRIEYLVDHHINAITELLRPAVVDALGLSEKQFMHWYYLLAGASSLIFSHAPECELLFGVDPNEESIIDAHAEMVVAALLGKS